jgi:release factor glutamine methyltransferase
MTATPLSAAVARLRAAGCVFAEDEAGLLHEAAAGPAELDALLERRVAGLPLEHLLGWAEFAGLRIVVAPGVFVPRRRTEFLAERAAALARPGAVVLDLCCGSGALGAALLAALGELELHAADIDASALRCARRNLPTARVYQGDLFAPLPDGLRGRIEVLVANTPYVPTEAIATMPPEARDHEPRRSLDGGADGLDVQRRVAAQAPGWLAPRGHLLVETSTEQAPVTASVFRAHGMAAEVAESEELGATVVIGVLPSGEPGPQGRRTRSAARSTVTYKRLTR